VTTLTAPSVRLPDAIASTLVTPAAYASAEIHDAYRWLRAHQPLGRAEPEGYDPFWVVTRYDDVQAVSRQNDLFRNGDRNPMLVNTASDRLTRSMTGGSPHLAESLVQLDGERHMKLRLLTQAWFMPKNLKTIEARVDAIAADAVEHMAELGGACDFVDAVALRYPLRVVMDILGVPPNDEPLMLRLTQEIFAPGDPDLVANADPEDPTALLRAFAAAVGEIDIYFRKITEDRRAHPRDDIASVIANATIEGRPLTPAEELGYYGIIATAGHDTTSSSSAGAMLALAQNPALLAAVRADRSLIPALVDEAIRIQSPVKTFMRTSAADTQVGDQAIRQGDWLMLCYASANRDEAYFEAPDAFRIDRPARHLAFGYGAHVCLGQHLAKLEMRLLFERLLDRLEWVELAGPATQIQSCFVNGPKSVPIRYRMRR
jgi:cytochrome P450